MNRSVDMSARETTRSIATAGIETSRIKPYVNEV